ncbi:hypothetical protein LZG75_03425 [Polynucleobacter sp. IMCC30063]|uniref:B12-binding domain-containing radical SAM protein n=1 Tax=Polynucleobacter sp. IMCC30063 TaxID=2907298 RepID=UPI001F330C76|nr:hypothetical protein [Polynucleobacter sp. IMCC30063]MCE7505281.1 hypothetical protein [Polynucleobacter sp. IMCC30063]
MNRNIYFSDLCHDAQGISAPTFPLGISYVVSYAKHIFKDKFKYSLFKFPNDLNQALLEEYPLMLCFSSYSWNHNIAYEYAKKIKEVSPSTITVFGGPNFPQDSFEKNSYLSKYSCIDFFIEQEGELGFVDLIEQLIFNGFNSNDLKKSKARIKNVIYLDLNQELISGEVERINDINLIPSPYLSGILDPFFKMPLIPMLETTRGCPFSCTFCTDGIGIKNKVSRFHHDRVSQELEYIAKRIKNIDELIITDLNFAMYTNDSKTAQSIMHVKSEFGWPKLLSASAGKNKPHRTIETATILGGMWTLGASIQSTDSQVLKLIKRSNISSLAYKELINYGNSLENSKTHSEIILGLPGDTKEKHYQSLRFGIDNKVNSMRMFQAMLLMGTEMATIESRNIHGLTSRYRVIPGCLGLYPVLLNKKIIAEFEEIIISSDTLSFEDYSDCRKMNLIIETFYNNAIFEEYFELLDVCGISVFDCLLEIKNNELLFPNEIKAIFLSFLRHTQIDLFETLKSAEIAMTNEYLEKNIRGENGINELLAHKAMLFNEFQLINEMVFNAIKNILIKEKNKDINLLIDYLSELKMYILRKKGNCINDYSKNSWEFHFDFIKLSKLNFKVNPIIYRVDTPIKLIFSHSNEAIKHIKNSKALYLNTPIGLGRLIQRTNLKNMFREIRYG